MNVPWLVFFGALPVLALALVARGLLVDRRRLRPWLEERGYRLRRAQMRFLTSGPFQDIRLPGTKHGDSLYRVIADDGEGRERVLWVRMPARAPWARSDWELRIDDAPERTRRGLGMGAFAAFVLGLMLLVGGLILVVSRQAGAH